MVRQDSFFLYPCNFIKLSENPPDVTRIVLELFVAKTLKGKRYPDISLVHINGIIQANFCLQTVCGDVRIWLFCQLNRLNEGKHQDNRG